MGLTTSTPSHGHGREKKLLIIEVLGGWVGDREWRLGDWWTIGVLGLIRPYIVVSHGGRKHETGVVEMPLGSREDCAANFDVRMALPLASADAPAGSTPGASSSADEVHISVRDRRYVQALVRGDPLIGEATLILDRSADGKMVCQRLELHRQGREAGRRGQAPAAWVNVQYQVVEPQSLRRILAMPSQHSLQEVAKAISDVLRTPDGVDRLLAAKPSLDATTGSCSPRTFKEVAGKLELPLVIDADGREREAVKKFADKLRTVADGMESLQDAGEEEVLSRLGSVAREILVFVGTFACREGTGEGSDTMALAMQWVKNFFATMVPDCNGEPMKPNLSRLDRLFTLMPLNKDDLVPVDKWGHQVSVPRDWNPGCGVPAKAILGEGSYGVVWRARDKSTKQIFAVKKMPAASGVANLINNREKSVAAHLRAVAHPCVVRLLDILEHSDSCSVVMEFCCHGDLQDRIEGGRHGERYDRPKPALAWAAQVFLGLEYLHTCVGMLVRDVKPQNVVIGTGLRAKLTDFGMSRLAATSDGTCSFHPSVPPGSPHYVAPEVILGNGYDYHADLYSLAVLVWTLLTGGLKHLKEAQPPCAKMRAHGPDRLMPLVNNWKLLQAAIEDPQSQGARPLPNDESKDFILKLLDRKKEHPWVNHEEVRQLPFFRDADLPPPGDNQATVDWLERSVNGPLYGVHDP